MKYSCNSRFPLFTFSFVPERNHSLLVLGSMGRIGSESTAWKSSATACSAVRLEKFSICTFIGPKLVRCSRCAALLLPSKPENKVNPINPLFFRTLLYWQISDFSTQLRSLCSCDVGLLDKLRNYRLI